jgi:hypothetical protein
MAGTVFGIRHHGPGCAHSLRTALAALRPDLLLVESPPDADDQIAAIAQPGMMPPLALLVHRVDAPEHATFYPFALFSPEGQALHGRSRTACPRASATWPARREWRPVWRLCDSAPHR